MSTVPAWKQAIIQRRKQQEEEQRKKEAENEAYLASLPPWKRALVLRREMEKKETKAPATDVPQKRERSDSFTKWEKQRNQETGRKPSWVKPASPTDVTPTPTACGSSSVKSASNPAASAQLASTSPSHVFGGPPTQRSSLHRESITVLPAASDSITFKGASSPPASSILTGGVSLRKKDESKKQGSVKVKRKSFEEDDPKYANMPAWKKALLMRRKASQTNEPAKQTDDHPREGSASPDVKTSNVFNVYMSQTPVQTPSVVTGDKPIPQSGDAFLPESPKSSVGPRPATTKTKLTASVNEDIAPLVPAPKAVPSKVTPLKPAPSRPAPSRPAPSHPAPSMPAPGPSRPAPSEPSSAIPKLSSAPPRKQSLPTKTPPSQPPAKKAPEIVNRRVSDIDQPNRLVKQEGITLHAPVFKEVEQWANVSEEDPKFVNLPQWKQALIKRRRADIAKRTGTNAPAISPPHSPTENHPPHSPTENRLPHSPTENRPPHSPTENRPPHSPTENRPPHSLTKNRPPHSPTENHQPYSPTINNPPHSHIKNINVSTRSTPKETTKSSTPIPTWKQELLKRRSSGSGSSMSQEERKLMGGSKTTPQPSGVVSGNVKALLGKFSHGGGLPQPSLAQKPNPVVQPRKSWSQVPQPTRIPPIIAEEALSDGSDEDLEDITLTNIDDIASDEDDDDDSGIGKGGGSSQVVLISMTQQSSSFLSPLTTGETSGSRKEERRPSILSDPATRPRRVSYAHNHCSYCFINN